MEIEPLSIIIQRNRLSHAPGLRGVAADPTILQALTEY
jgi:hypothetical protein